MLAITLVFGITVAGCATAPANSDGDGSQASFRLGQPAAVGTWTLSESSITATYIINAGDPYYSNSGTYSVTMSYENNAPAILEAGSWELSGGGYMTFTISGTGQKYTGRISFNKLIIGRLGDKDSITLTKQ